MSFLACFENMPWYEIMYDNIYIYMYMYNEMHIFRGMLTSNGMTIECYFLRKTVSVHW